MFLSGTYDKAVIGGIYPLKRVSTLRPRYVLILILILPQPPPEICVVHLAALPKSSFPMWFNDASCSDFSRMVPR